MMKGLGTMDDLLARAYELLKGLFWENIFIKSSTRETLVTQNSVL